MTYLIACGVALAAFWLVCRAVAWLPTYYAKEEQRWIRAAQQAHRTQFQPPEVPPAPALWREFFSAAPPFNQLTVIAIIALGLVAVGLWRTLPPGWLMAAWFVYACGLITLALVDHQTKLLPDILTMPLLWLGFLIQLFPETASFGLETAVMGAVLGYLPLWLLAQAYRLIRGRDGLGMGDLKLLAAMGAWSGPSVLPPVIFAAAFFAIVWLMLQRLFRRQGGHRHEEHPFGPWLILAYLLIVLLPISR